MSPNTRTTAFFYAMRLNPDKAQVANTMMEMLGKKENEGIVSEALFRMPYEDHRKVLAIIAASPNPNKFDAIGKIYRGGSITLRSDLLTELAKLKDDRRAESFIMDAAQNDKDLAVRTAALDALMLQQGTADEKSPLNLLNRASPRGPTAPSVVPPVPPRRGAPGAPQK